LKSLHAKIGELTLENDFWEGALGKAGMLSAKPMIDRSHAPPIARQAKALNISRGSVYYLPRPAPTACARGRSRHHAPHGRIASRFSVRGEPDAARPFDRRRR
jgi:hypothetical protein